MYNLSKLFSTENSVPKLISGLFFTQNRITSRCFNISSANGTNIQLFGAQFDSLLEEAKVTAHVFSDRV